MVMVKGLTMMFALVVVSIYVDQVDKACQEREKRKEMFSTAKYIVVPWHSSEQFAPTVEM